MRNMLTKRKCFVIIGKTYGFVIQQKGLDLYGFTDPREARRVKAGGILHHEVRCGRCNTLRGQALILLLVSPSLLI